MLSSPRTHLVLGGVRSGKSRHAENLLAGRADVTYVAPGPQLDDADWAARVAAHRARRPSTWTTAETVDIAGVLDSSDGAVLVDCLGTWTTRLLDEASAWDDRALAHEVVASATDRLVAALARRRGTVVLVTNEVGLGVVPPYRSGRIFRDELGHVNAAVSAVADRVELVVAGRVLDLSGAPLVAP